MPAISLSGSCTIRLKVKGGPNSLILGYSRRKFLFSELIKKKKRIYPPGVSISPLFKKQKQSLDSDGVAQRKKNKHPEHSKIVKHSISVSSKTLCWAPFHSTLKRRRGIKAQRILNWPFCHLDCLFECNKHYCWQRQ